jgi:hypothetical protein
MTRTASLLALTAFLAALGCGDEQASTPTAATALRPAAALSAPGTASVAQDLATLRQVTASFHDFQTAAAAGWGAQITPCMESPEGGMGFHYGNTAFIDGTARVDQPELLLYEPESNGRLRLVAVEYIIPYTLHSRDAAPPVLFGQEFQQVDAFQLWGLHAWVWKNNPSGMFANWNPEVSCAATALRSTMTH